MLIVELIKLFLYKFCPYAKEPIGSHGANTIGSLLKASSCSFVRNSFLTTI